MSNGYYLFWLAELFIGVLVGMCVAKHPSSLRTGLALTLVLGTVAIVELIVVNELKHNLRQGNFVGYVVDGLGFLFPFWSFCLLFAFVGYWLASWASGQLGIGGWQFGIPTLLALVAIYAIVAAIGRMM